MVQDNTPHNSDPLTGIPEDEIDIETVRNSLQQQVADLRADLEQIHVHYIAPLTEAEWNPVKDPFHRIEARMMYEVRALRHELAQFQLGILRTIGRGPGGDDGEA